jgi:hypothetical protein
MPKVRFSVEPLEIFKWLNASVHSASNRNEYQGISFGVKYDRRV